MLPRTFPFLPILLILVLSPAVRSEPPGTGTRSNSTGESLSRTQHSLTLNGNKLDYEATAGTLNLNDDEGKTTARIFFVAYTKKEEKADKRRPVTFAFNGGPGSSAVWLHLGAFGPRRVEVSADGRSIAPPYQLIENESTLLDLTDLVFIDPVSTGYSRATNPKEAGQFHSVEGDVRSIGDFIHHYLTRFNRWDSPKFLAGESYGTTRAAALAEHLQEHQGIYLNGVILLSAVLNFQTISFNDGNDLPYVLSLPSYAATAWYHKRLAADLQADQNKTIKEVEQFALKDYATALMRGFDLSTEERQTIARQLARYTGLSADYILRCNLRVDISRFRKELLRDQEQIVGRYDSRYKGADRDPAGDEADFDPSYPVVQGPMTSVMNAYLRDTLKYDSELDYRILTGKVSPWNFDAQNRYLNVAPRLRQAMVKNPDLRVFVANGLYDLATPFAATRHTFRHLGPNLNQKPRVTIMDYGAGHMMYTERESRRKLKSDLEAFYQSDKRVEGKMRTY